MQTKTELTGLKQKIIIHRLLGTSLASFAVFLLGFIFLPVLIAEASATKRVDANIRWSAIDLTFDPDVDATTDATDPEAELASATHGDIAFGTIVPTVKAGSNYGTMVIKKKTLGVTTRGKYYAVYLSMNDAETALTYEGATDTSMKISSTSGTWDNPVTFVTNNNSGWGYMVPGTTVTKSDGTASYFSSLDQENTATAIDDFINQNIHSADGTAYTDTRWAAVPAAKTATTTTSKPQQIWKGLTNNGAGFSTQDTFNIYYAINVDTDIMAGTYENQIVYTAIASSESLDSVSNNLARTTKFGTAGTVQTIYFDLAQTATGMIGYDDITIKLVPHTTMAAANYNPASLSAEAKAAAITCPKVANSFSTVTTTQAETEGSLTTIQCTMPTAAEATEYDYWLSIDGYNFNYASKIDNGDEAGFAYVGLQTKRANGTPYVTTMQDMSAGVCANTNRWDNGLGSQAKLYTPTASTAAANTGTQIQTIANGGTLPNNYATSTIADGIGTFALRDSRDGKRYLVRRLADGNCWMVQNLNLDLYTGMTLTSADSDLNGERTTWTIADAADSNNDATIATYGYTSYKWVAGAGSTSTAWQTAHGVESVTLTEYTYGPVAVLGENEEPTGDYVDAWSDGSTVANCSGGTAQAPCYATAITSNAYYKVKATQQDVDAGRATVIGEIMATPVTVDAETAYKDGYCDGTCAAQEEATHNGSTVRGFAAGAYYTTVTYEVRKMKTNLSSANVYGYDVIDNRCTFSYYNDRLKSDNACVLTTSGDTMLTQFANAATIGMNSSVIPRLAITKDSSGTTLSFSMNNTADGVMAYIDATYTTFPLATDAADYRWNQMGRDGVHVLDAGPLRFTTSVTDDGTTYTLASGGGTGTKCDNVGTVQGTLTNASGNAYSFVSCMDSDDAATEDIDESTYALADSRVDGNWYNWYAVVAGSSYPVNTSTPATDSICPKGWKLPTDNESFNKDTKPSVSSSYSLITTNTGSSPKIASDKTYAINNNTDGNQGSSGVDTKIQAFPLSFVRSGYYLGRSGGLISRGGYGGYWLAGSISAANSRAFFFYSTSLTPRSSINKGYGLAVRCVASAE